MIRTLPLIIAACLLAGCAQLDSRPDDTLVISFVGLNDVHGQLLPDGDKAGLTTISGYVNALREIRANDGALLLIDAGDMWQGTIESNRNEGAAVVAAYNAMNVTAAAIGNHEFDFGPVGPAPIPANDTDDPRGALKARATEADFPLLAANLIDVTTGQPVEWPNVQPSIMREVAGIKIGIIGVMTSMALKTTIAANTPGLRVAPLAATIEREAIALRNNGASLVIVTSHAGGECLEFDDPDDLSSCNPSDEIFAVAQALPTDLVDHIFAGHKHKGMAHIVNGISISSSYSSTRAFSRVDFILSARTGQRLSQRVFAPRLAIPGDVYEGKNVLPDEQVLAIAAAALASASMQKNESIGILLESPFTLEGNPESALGNLFTQALYESLPVDVAIHNVAGGLRSSLPAGELTFGDVYALSPFDNRAVILELTGRELRTVIAKSARRGPRSIGFHGMQVTVDCNNSIMSVDMQLHSGAEIEDSDSVSVVVNDYIALGGDAILDDVIPEQGFPIDDNQPLTRDVFVQWLAERGGTLRREDFLRPDEPAWTRPDAVGPDCQLH
jgi:5'-nucleotidase